MEREPLVTIGAVMTSVKLAVVAVVAVLVIDMDPDRAALVIAAASAVTIALGDILQLIIGRRRVTPASDPVIPATFRARTTDGRRVTRVDAA